MLTEMYQTVFIDNVLMTRIVGFGLIYAGSLYVTGWAVQKRILALSIRQFRRLKAG